MDLCICLCHIVLSVSRSVVVTRWKRADHLVHVYVNIILFLSLSLIWYPGSGVVLDCIDSWSLSASLLWLLYFN